MTEVNLFITEITATLTVISVEFVFTVVRSITANIHKIRKYDRDHLIRK